MSAVRGDAPLSTFKGAALPRGVAKAMGRAMPLRYASGFDPDREPAGHAVVVADNGVYRYARADGFDLAVPIQGAKGGTGGPFRRFVRNTGLPRLPIAALATAFEFYSAVNDACGLEAQMTFFLHRDGVDVPDDPGIAEWGDGVFSYVPRQVNSSASSHTDDVVYLGLMRTFPLIAETHSHDVMEPFASSTDVRNSDKPGLQIVFGRLGSDRPGFTAWLAIDSGFMLKDMDADEAACFIECPQGVMYDDGPVAQGYLFGEPWAAGGRRAGRPVRGCTGVIDQANMLDHSVFDRYRDVWMSRVYTDEPCVHGGIPDDGWSCVGGGEWADPQDPLVDDGVRHGAGPDAGEASKRKEQ